MPRSLSLLFVVTEDWYFVSHRLPLAIAARDAGFTVSVVTRCSRHCTDLDAAGIRTISFDMKRRGMNPLGVVREVAVLARILRQVRPDLVHLVALRPVVVGNLAARLAGVTRIVSAVTGMGFLFSADGRQSAIRSLLQRAFPWLLARGITIVQNRDDARLLQSFGLAPSRIQLIAGAGVDTSRFVPHEACDDRLVVMLASRLLWDKGIGEFVESARRLQASGARFVLVGAPDSGNPASVTDSELRAWSAEGVIEWWGHREDMVATLNQADIVCLPSYREGLPKVLLEAMACGKPCIATDAPGCRELVRHYENGLLVPIKDAEALTEAIEKLLKNVALRRKLGVAGRERVEREFAVEKVVAAHLEVYREQLAGAVQ